MISDRQDIVRRGGAALLQRTASGPAARERAVMMPPDASPRENLVQIAWRRKWTVVAVVVLCLSAGAAYLRYATPVFTSYSRLYVEPSGTRIFMENPAMLVRPGTYLNTQCQLISSAPIVLDAIERSGARSMKTFEGTTDVVGAVQESLGAEVGKKDDIITVWFDSPYPDEATKLVRAVIDSYQQYHAKQKRSTAAEVLRILTKEKESRDAELAEKMKEMLEFQRSNGTLSFESDRGNIILGRLARLADALTAAQLKRIEADANFRAAELATASREGLAQLIESQQSKGNGSMDPEYADLIAQLNRLKTYNSGMAPRAGPNHPSMQLSKETVGTLETRIAEKQDRFAKAYLASLEQQCRAARKAEEEIATLFGDQQKQAFDLNDKSAEQTRVKSELARIEKLCDTLDSRIKELRVSEETGGLEIRVIEPAQADASPSSPRPVKVAGMALAMGLMLGMGLAFMRDTRDQRFRSDGEIKASLGMPVLCVVPHIPGKRPAAVCGQIVHLEPSSEAAEAYRVIRTAIYFGAGPSTARTVLVASPSSGDGKTTVACNLAIALAQAGHRTCLLEADLRRPKIGTIFAVDPQTGMFGHLMGRLRLEEALQPSGIPGLDVLICETPPRNPAEIVNSRLFSGMLRTLAASYDYVVIDSPPVLNVTDASILAAEADLTLLVLRADKSDRHTSEAACDALMNVGARVLGVVANGVRGQKGYYAYGNYHRDEIVSLGAPEVALTATRRVVERVAPVGPDPSPAVENESLGAVIADRLVAPRDETPGEPAKHSRGAEVVCVESARSFVAGASAEGGRYEGISSGCVFVMSAQPGMSEVGTDKTTRLDGACAKDAPGLGSGDRPGDDQSEDTIGTAPHAGDEQDRLWAVD